ncbi:MAG TPA: hypothetical protein VEA36_00330 [Candidatus Paceibacterota bacterium]|nr:hypothetical protein [Candidatus Paceibacterota bacterium]
MDRRHIGIAIAAGAFILLTAWQATHLHRYLAPDSFTYFAMAKEFHESELLYSYSGVDHTTGIHPGYYFLLLPLYPGVGAALPAASFILNALFILGGLFLLYRALGFMPTAVIFLLTLTSQAAGALNNGMESSLLFFALSLATYLYLAKVEPGDTPSLLLLGAALALALFARLDAIFFVAALYLVFAYRMLMQDRSINGLIGHVRTFMALSLPVFAALGIIFAINLTYDGTLLPLSGQLKSSLPHVLPNWAASLPLLKMFIAGIAAMGAYLVYRMLKRRPLQELVPALFIGSIALFTYNLFYVSGIGAWYGALPFFGAALALGLLVHDLWTDVPGRYRRISTALVLVAFAVAVPLGHANRIVTDWITPNQAIAEELDRQAADGEAAAEFKDGVVAFYSRVPVYSLTGLANNQAYVDAVRKGTLEAYLAERGIAYIAHGIGGSGLQVPEAVESIECTRPFYEKDGALLSRVADCAVVPTSR